MIGITKTKNNLTNASAYAGAAKAEEEAIAKYKELAKQVE